MCEDFNSFMNQINWFIDQKKCEVIENESNLILKIFLPINTIKESYHPSLFRKGLHHIKRLLK